MIDVNVATRTLRSPVHIQRLVSVLHSFIEEGIRNKPRIFLRKMSFEDTGKPLYGCDLFAEDFFIEDIKSKFGALVLVNGEETLGADVAPIAEKSRIHILCDVIDGSDLLVRGFSNWCTAAVVFDTEDKAIISSFIYVRCDRRDDLYVASEESTNVILWQDETVTVDDKTGKTRQKSFRNSEIVRVNNSKSLRDASICYYGQKTNRIVSLCNFLGSPEVRAAFEDMPNVRWYNMAGNPMMCRMIDGSVDLIFELHGQKLHDVIPGAYIALKAGAIMYDLRTKPIRENRKIFLLDLITVLLESEEDIRLNYILAANEEIAGEFLEICKKAGVIK